MKKHFQGYKVRQRRKESEPKYILILLVITLIIALVLVTKYSRYEDPFFSKYFSLIIFPISKSGNMIVSSIQNLNQNISALFYTRAEVIRLKQENRKLKLENARFIGIKRKLENYDNILRFRSTVPYTTIVANVIGVGDSATLKTIIIDKGTIDGVSKDMPVIVYEGVVGRIETTLRRASRVLLATDQNSSISAINISTGDLGLITGAPPGVYLNFELPYGFTANLDDKILTSNLSVIFPPNIEIGRVVGITVSGPEVVSYFRVQPSVDIRNLTEVLIITNLGREDAITIGTKQ